MGQEYPQHVNKAARRSISFFADAGDLRIYRCCDRKGSLLLGGYRYPTRGYTFSPEGADDWLSGKDEIRHFQTGRRLSDREFAELIAEGVRYIAHRCADVATSNRV